MKVDDLKRLVETDWQLNDRAAAKNGRNRWSHPLRVLNGMNVENITVAVIEGYKAQRVKEGAARQTVNLEIGLIRRGLRLAFEQELLPRIPRVRNLRVQNAREGFVDPPDFLRIVRTLEALDPPVAEVVTFLYLLGWRREEVLGLTWAEVDAEAGLLRLPATRHKNRTPKTIRVGEGLHEILRRRAALRKGPFVFHREGDQIRTFRGPWRRAARAIGKPGLLVHDLRRSFARNALQAGLPIPLIMELGGWKTASMLYRYAINDEALLHRGSQRVCDYTVKLQETAEKKKKGEPAFFALPKWLAGALRSLSQAQRAEALDLMRSYGIEEERPDSP